MYLAFICYTIVMLIIGHRGARGAHPENTIAALQAGFEMGVDALEFDVRLTKDNIPILIHDRTLLRTHQLLHLIGRSTFANLQELLQDKTNPIATLDEVLELFGNRILLNLELKDRGSAAHVLPQVERRIQKKEDWNTFLFSSFKVSELQIVRQISPYAQTGLLQWLNPLHFTSIYNDLQLDAVGFHRLHVNSFTVNLAKELGLFTYAYTVNRAETAARMEAIGIDGIITDAPETIMHFLERKAELKA